MAGGDWNAYRAMLDSFARRNESFFEVHLIKLPQSLLKTFNATNRTKGHFENPPPAPTTTTTATTTTTTALSHTVDWVLLTSANISRSAWGQLNMSTTAHGQKKGTVLKISHYEMGVLIRPEYVSSKPTFSVTPNHPVLGLPLGNPSYTSPNNCFLSLMNEQGVGSAELNAVFTPIPHRITSHVEFGSEQKEQAWRWDTRFDGQDDFGEECDGSFVKNVVGDYK